MESKGWEPYDLASHFCEECGRPKLNRLFFGEMTCGDCATCMEVITRHRCTNRPHIESLANGESWECPDCGSIWTRIEHYTYCVCDCGGAGHRVPDPYWDSTEGPRMDTAPRYHTPAYTPLRNIFREGPPPPKEGKYPFPGLPF